MASRNMLLTEDTALFQCFDINLPKRLEVGKGVPVNE
jgi:hypothetical protein